MVILRGIRIKWLFKKNPFREFLRGNNKIGQNQAYNMGNWASRRKSATVRRKAVELLSPSFGGLSACLPAFSQWPSAGTHLPRESGLALGPGGGLWCVSPVACVFATCSYNSFPLLVSSHALSMLRSSYELWWIHGIWIVNLALKRLLIARETWFFQTDYELPSMYWFPFSCFWDCVVMQLMLASASWMLRL